MKIKDPWHEKTLGKCWPYLAGIVSGVSCSVSGSNCNIIEPCLHALHCGVLLAEHSLLNRTFTTASYYGQKSFFCSQLVKRHFHSHLAAA